MRAPAGDALVTAARIFADTYPSFNQFTMSRLSPVAMERTEAQCQQIITVVPRLRFVHGHMLMSDDGGWRSGGSGSGDENANQYHSKSDSATALLHLFEKRYHTIISLEAPILIISVGSI